MYSERLVLMAVVDKQWNLTLKDLFESSFHASTAM